MVLFIEGCDNVGKSTQIAKIKKYVEEKYRIPVHLMHYTNFSKEISPNEIRNLSEKLYSQMFDIVNTHENECLIICDRSHIGEAVYSPIYRKYDGDYVFEIEKKFMKANADFRGGRLLFIDNPKELINRDDGKSFSIDYETKKNEVERFLQAFDKSSLYKKFIDLKGRNAEEIFEQEVLSFVDNLVGDKQL